MEGGGESRDVEWVPGGDGMFEQARRASEGSATGHDAAASAVGKHTRVESMSSPTHDARGGGGGGEVVDDRTTGALIGGGIGAVGGAIIGGLAGGVPGAIGGAVVGGAVGAGIGAAVGGAGGGGAATAVPTPVAVRNGPTHAPLDSGNRIGMSIAITITSSSGVDADMARIQDSEQVGLSYNHTGSCASLPPLPSSQSGFMPGHPIPDDEHTWTRTAVLDRADNHGGNGSFEKQQLDIYTDAAAGVTTPVAIPNSGYIIKRIITSGPGTRVVFRTEKRAAAVTVNGYSSAAGPSGTQHDDVVARA
jgi:hypothetical protein